MDFCVFGMRLILQQVVSTSFCLQSALTSCHQWVMHTYEVWTLYSGLCILDRTLYPGPDSRIRFWTDAELHWQLFLHLRCWTLLLILWTGTVHLCIWQYTSIISNYGLDLGGPEHHTMLPKHFYDWNTPTVWSLVSYGIPIPFCNRLQYLPVRWKVLHVIVIGMY